MSRIEITICPEGCAAQWDDFARKHGSFFHRYGWGQAIAKTYRQDAVFLWARVDGEVVGILPLIDRRSVFFGKALISVGFTVGGGVCAVDEAAQLALMNAACDQAKQRDCAYVELRSQDQTAHGWHEKHGIYDTFSTQIIADPEARLKAIPRKKRADLRKAIKSADTGTIQASVTKDTGLFWSSYARAQRDHGTPVFPRSWISQQQAVFGEDVEITLVTHGDTPLAGVMSYYDGETVHLYNAFVSDQARRYHAGDYLYWWMMQHAFERSAKTFDLGRSKRGTGAHAYKTYWGFQPVPLVYLYKLLHTDELPNLNPNNPKFSLMTKVWRRLPLVVANRLGPLLARHLA